MKRFISASAQETKRLGRRLGVLLNQGDVVALIGELGTGKTMFTKGIAEGLGVKDARHVNSPSFVIVKEHEGAVPLYHMDLYRLTHGAALESIGCEEYLRSPGVCVVEWAEKIMHVLPEEYLRVEIEHSNRRKRIITFFPKGKRFKDYIAKI